MQRSLDALAKLLLANHGKNGNGCLITEYSRIPGLRVKASDTNGTSGIGVWDGVRVYWRYETGNVWTRDTSEWKLANTPGFVVERA